MTERQTYASGQAVLADMPRPNLPGSIGSPIEYPRQRGRLSVRRIAFSFC